MSDLSNDALDSAIELDKLLRGNWIDEAPLWRLAAALRVDYSHGSIFYNLFACVFEDATGSRPATVDDLNLQLETFANRLLIGRALDPDADTTRALLTFCLSLHRQLLLGEAPRRLP